jgi:hypothetical protein
MCPLLSNRFSCSRETGCPALVGRCPRCRAPRRDPVLAWRRGSPIERPEPPCITARALPARGMTEKPCRPPRSAIDSDLTLRTRNPRAVINRRELGERFARAGDALEESDVDLQPMPRLRLLVALPALGVRPMLLIRREPVQSWRTKMRCTDDTGHGELVKRFK